MRYAGLIVAGCSLVVAAGLAFKVSRQSADIASLKKDTGELRETEQGHWDSENRQLTSVSESFNRMLKETAEGDAASAEMQREQIKEVREELLARMPK